MYQVIKAVLKDKEDTTQMSLVYANNSEDDILLREELDSLAATHPQRFKVCPICGVPLCSRQSTECLSRGKLGVLGSTKLVRVPVAGRPASRLGGW
jgi:NAD(P)H-flavin reductase